MPSKTEPDSGARPHRPRQKTKPKFELPVEAAKPAASAAWVHRSETEVHKKTEPVAAVAKETKAKTTLHAPSPATAATNPTFVRLGVTLFAAGATVIGQLSLAAFDMVTMPLRWGRAFLASNTATK
jgi:hypothetical protein